MRPTAAAGAGVAVAAAAALVLGDYPLSGAVPWVAALIVPLLVGVTMTMVDHRHRAWLWIGAGPLAAASVAWGVWIAGGRGLDPVPASAWAAMALALVWPPAWAARLRRRSRATGRAGSADLASAPPLRRP